VTIRDDGGDVERRGMPLAVDVESDKVVEITRDGVAIDQPAAGLKRMAYADRQKQYRGMRRGVVVNGYRGAHHSPP
jgi:hypothetical protein